MGAIILFCSNHYLIKYKEDEEIINNEVGKNFKYLIRTSNESKKFTIEEDRKKS